MQLTKYEKDLINEVNQKWFTDPPRDIFGAIESGWTPVITIKNKEFSSRTGEEKTKILNSEKNSALKAGYYWSIDFDNQNYEFFPISVAEEKLWKAPLNR